MSKLLVLSLIAGATILGLPGAAGAQGRIRQDAMDRAGRGGDQFYHNPREFQIIDERPTIRDFREAPSSAPTIDLPGAPGGGAGGARMAGDNALPVGGLPLGDPARQGFRSAPAGLGALPKSGFGGTNIPARGLGPRGALPGVTQGVVGKMMSQNKGVGAGAPSGLSPSRGRTAGNYRAPQAASYSGGYGQGSGSASGGSASRTDTMVRGTLLRSK